MNIKKLNPESSAKAAYGARLRGLRIERGWTQEWLGIEIGYSSTHISSVETGRKLATLRFSRSTDRALGLVGSDASFERELSRIKFGSMLEGSPEFLIYEGRAAEIRLYEVGVMPGLLQTPEYARVLADSAVKRKAITPVQAEERIALVAERQAALVRDNPPLVFALLDESCLRRSVGSPEVMRAQMDRLIEFAEQPHTVIQVAPFDMGENRPFDLPIYILTMPDRSLMSYAESAQQGYLERESSSVVPHLTAYHQMQAAAPSQAASVDMFWQLRKGF
ncbi:helix-turn-helix transcriptional regulator [Streptomyces griseus]|uniref:helix-turn-helix domain-containing protein n=1 Tax=Streptomyces griseus TaxID=1911 RepID=UPI0004C75B5C|nr:helix-turn-helix transcriptional regulator [Streptomyces griseus]KOG80449.1 DNA-binding protein [Streptomyces griseus subsp. rhodochrous]